MLDITTFIIHQTTKISSKKFAEDYLIPIPNDNRYKGRVASLRRPKRTRGPRIPTNVREWAEYLRELA